MTAADIALTTGAPDNGCEGFRFCGYTIYGPIELTTKAPDAFFPRAMTSKVKQVVQPQSWYIDLATVELA